MRTTITLDPDVRLVARGEPSIGHAVQATLNEAIRAFDLDLERFSELRRELLS